MARYDVFLVNALADTDKAALIVRRLRALKFKVRYDKKRDHTTPTPKDYRDADNAQSVLILWSKDACNTDNTDSDWVHAIAHHARSKPGVLLQSGLDKTVPDEPFGDDPRYALSGMGPRKIVNGFYDLIEELGRRDGRKDLRAWMDLKASDKDGKAAWKDAHPIDPLSQVPKPKRKAPPVAAAAASVAAATPAPAPAPAPTETVATAKRVIPPLEITPPSVPKPNNEPIGQLMLGAVGVVIAGMLILSAAMKTTQGLPAIAGVSSLEPRCPAGQMPSYLLEQQIPRPLEPGPIIDDTEDPEPT